MIKIILLTMWYFTKHVFRQKLYFEVKSFIFKNSLSTIKKSLQQLKMEAPKHRENPVVSKLDSKEFKSIFTPELKSLAELFEKHNFEIRIAGGAVRDLLMGKVPKDIDFATNATPEQMKSIFEKEEIRMINTKGEKHGTITPRINDKENFEVTTLRVDVVTDGRHAEVQFTEDWMLDANRRDLTINSMFLGLDGTVYDYFYGFDDLQKRKIAFVGDADSRIKEDYLRILRYFRFYGRIAEQPDNHDEQILRIITQNADGLARISGERIWSELKKILEGNFAGELVKTMHHVGILKYCGFPEKLNLEELERVWSRAKHLNLRAVTLMCALLSNCDDILQINQRLKMSVFENELGQFVLEHREIKLHEKPLLPYKQLVVTGIRKPADVKEKVIEVLKYNNSPLLQEFIDWEVPKFPVPGTVLKERFDIPKGRFMGAVISELKKYWAERGFTTDVEELLGQVPAITSMLQEKKIK